MADDSKQYKIEIKKEYYENGNLMSETSYLDGKKHGLYKDYFKTGELSCSAEYIDDLLHGEHKVYYNGILETDETIFVNDQELNFDDVEEYDNISDELIKRVVYLVKGVSVFEILYWKDGYKSEFCILNGKPHGLAVDYYDTGELRRVYNYVNGVIDGKSLIYYKNGYLHFKSNFSNGKLNGLKQKYRANGELVYEVFYENDEMIEKK